MTKEKLSVVFVTQEDEVHSSIVLEKLIQSKDINVELVITSDTIVENKGLVASSLEVIKKCGFTYFLMRVREAIHYKFFSSETTVKDLISRHDLNHTSTRDINSPETVSRLKKIKPDFILSCVFNQIFRGEILSIPKCGFYNIHRAHLPDYRGVSPTFWVLANDENYSGITMHKVTENIDHGEIYWQKMVDIDSDDTVHSLSKKMMKLCAKDIVNVLKKIENEDIIPKMTKGFGDYYSWPDKECVKRFRKNKRKLY